MNESQSALPAEDYFDLFGITFPIHWDYHAILMVGIWLVLVPLCILAIRYGKPKPKPHGIREEIKLTNIAWWWFSLHKFGFYLAIGLSLAGLGLALAMNGGFSGSVHAMFGITAIVLGCLQIISAWLRGTHGGRYYLNANPDDPATWHGDHFDMTPRRRMFEAFHRTAGYFAGFFAIGAVASGLMQFSLPGLATVILIAGFVILALCVVLEFKGLRHDGYRAAFGNDRDHPYNKARENL